MKSPILRLPKTFCWLALGASVLVGLSGCNASDGAPSSSDEASVVEDSTPPPSSSPSTEVLPSPPLQLEPIQEEESPPAALNETLISAQGLGPARLGMTLGELKQALGPTVEFSPQSPFIVDFDAIAVRYNNETLFYLLHLAGDPLQDNDHLQGIVTTHPLYRTENGVGVGTSVQLAETVYGKATLSYNTENESREYVRFEQHPATNISFGTQG
ncbi:MAG: hypothetical protein F6K09_28540, partial [Merismopedia sp. SIO2A8]|nr:hypothetical protein [Merismopedia sp. SIO2A8]